MNLQLLVETTDNFLNSNNCDYVVQLCIQESSSISIIYCTNWKI